MPRDSPDLEFRNDWETFVKSFLPRKIRRFESEDARDGPGRYVKIAVEAIQKGDPGLLIDTIDEDFRDYGMDQEYAAYQEALKEFANEWENPNDVKQGMENEFWFRERFDEIYEEREEFNWGIFFGNEEILVWNSKDAISAGWVGDPQEASREILGNPELEDWVKKALKFVSLKQISAIIDNGFDYDVTMFIGGLVGVEEVIKAMMSETPVAFHTGDVIVGAYDGLNGAGYFEHGSTKAHVGLVFGDKTNPIHIDWGSYSLGDVFGTKEWTWR